jgi:hypothetical protein
LSGSAAMRAPKLAGSGTSVVGLAVVTALAMRCGFGFSRCRPRVGPQSGE